MANEDFTTYTEGGADVARLSQTSSVATWTSLEVQDEAYLYDDKGAGYFSGDFVHLFEVEMTSGGNQTDNRTYLYSYMLSQGIGSVVDQVTAVDDFIGVAYLQSGGTQKKLQIVQFYSGSAYNGTAIVTDPGLNTTYYVTFERSGSDLILTVRNTSHSGSVEGTDTVTLQAVVAYRYALGTISVETGTGGTDVSSGTLGNLDLQETSGAISGLAAGTSTATGTLSATGDLAGLAAGTSTATGAIGGTGTLAGLTAGTSAATGAIGGTGALAGLAAGTSTATATIGATGDLAGLAAGTSTATGRLVQGALAGLAAGTSTATGTLTNVGIDTSLRIVLDVPDVDVLLKVSDADAVLAVADVDQLLKVWMEEI